MYKYILVSLFSAGVTRHLIPAVDLTRQSDNNIVKVKSTNYMFFDLANILKYDKYNNQYKYVNVLSLSRILPSNRQENVELFLFNLNQNKKNKINIESDLNDILLRSC
jgi:hypothetical protein